MPAEDAVGVYLLGIIRLYNRYLRVAVGTALFLFDVIRKAKAFCLGTS